MIPFIHLTANDSTLFFDNMKLRFFLPTIALAVPFVTSAATLDLSTPAQADELSDPRSITVIDDKAYVMNYERLQNGTPTKELYVLPTPETPATLLHSATGTLGDDDVVAAYDSALYHTVTRKRGSTVQVYRSTDDGDNWDMVADIGSDSAEIKNEVKGIIAASERLYVIVGQKHRYNGGTKRLSVWSTTNGTTWVKHTIKWARNQSLVQAFVWNDRPFLLLQGKLANENPQLRLYTTFTSSGKSLQKTAENNIRSDNPITTANGFFATDDALYITGTNDDGDAVSLRSTEGVSWDATSTAFEQIVDIDGILFGAVNNSLYYSTDGTTWDTTTFNFESGSGVDTANITRVFTPSQDGSGTALRIGSEEDGSDTQCWWSADGVTWSELETCAPAQQVDYRSVVSFGDFWYGIRGKQNHSVYRFSL